MKTRMIFLTLLLITACDNKFDWIEPAVDPPIVISITPTTGGAGTEVKVTGERFTSTLNNISVTVNGTSATVTDASATHITFITPSGTTGPVVVTVNNATAENQPVFTYQ